MAIPRVPFVEIALPDVPTHDAFIQLVPRIIKYIGMASLPFIVSASLLAFLDSAAIAGTTWLTIPLILFMALGVGIFVIVCMVLSRACGVLDELHEQWKADLEARREIERAKVLTLTVKGSNNSVNIDSPTTTNQAVVIESPDAVRFVKHFREFIQRAAFIKSQNDGEGTERRHYLHSDGAVRDYQFDDGTTITRPEYEMLIEMLRSAGQLPGRKQGTTGRLTKTINPGRASQPNQPVPTNHPTRAGD